jgi:cyclase
MPKGSAQILRPRFNESAKQPTMLRSRVIPCLLMENGGLVKTVQFGKRTYLGDPINVIRIFNDKEVDEIILLDIAATPAGREPDYDILEKIASQCFMPLAYGGGITRLDQVKRLLSLGVEKVVLNTAAIETPRLIADASTAYGSQAVVCSIDTRRTWFGRYEVYVRGGRISTNKAPIECAVEATKAGCGEILINSIDRDGTMKGYDIDLIRSIASSVDVPVVACGGAGSIDDFRKAVTDGQAAAVAAGSMFVFHGKHRAVLINYPSQDALAAAVGTREDAPIVS